MASNNRRSAFLILLATAVLSASAFSCGRSGATTTPPTTSGTPTVSPTTTPGQTVTIDLIAENNKFNLPQITVPAGAAVTVNFTNKDGLMAHNFSVYENLAAGQTRLVFMGTVVTGSGQTTYRFNAPGASASYFFECDVHPDLMNGKFIVTP